MYEALWGAIVGGLLTGGAAIGAQVWASRIQARAAREAFLQQDRVWHRDQRLEAHHAFLNQVNRLAMAIAASMRAGADAPNAEATKADLSDVVAKTVDALNRVELVVSPSTHELAVKILAAADERVADPSKLAAVLQDIGEAARKYREAAKAELKA
jgi:hypothetical protein